MAGIIFREKAKFLSQKTVVEGAPDIKDRAVILHGILKIGFVEGDRLIPIQNLIQIEVPGGKVERFIPGNTEVIQCKYTEYKEES